MTARRRFPTQQLAEYLGLVSFPPFNGFREEHFDFFMPSAARNWATHSEIETGLVRAWEAIRARLPRDEAAALGEIHTNQFDWSHAVAQADWERDDERRGERTNLAIELWPNRLEVDLVGWKVRQAELFEKWLAPRGIVDPKDGVDGYVLVVWRRHPFNYDRKGYDRPWWRRETPDTYELADERPLPDIRGQRLDTLRNRWRSEPDPNWEKLGYHLRRSWPRAQVVERGVGLIPEMVESVRELIPIAQRMSHRRWPPRSTHG